MRIIDKQQDYYDYLQSPTDTLVFDRRGSFLLTKEQFCKDLGPSWGDSKYRFVLLQCGATSWLFLAIIKEDNRSYDYSLELLNSWKNYNKEIKLLQIDGIDIRGVYGLYNYKIKDLEYDKIKSKIKDFTDAIDRNDFSVSWTISSNVKYTNYKNGYKKEKSNLPLLKACGISSLVQPLDMFTAIEEYFSLVKSNAETTEAKGTTNDDKIIMHGFDTKTSFRK